MRLGRRHHNFEGLGSGWDLDMVAGISFVRVIDGIIILALIQKEILRLLSVITR